MKTVLISIQPKWCEKIISGEKTVEVRKTRPKLETPFKCYIYCTKGDKDKALLVDGANSHIVHYPMGSGSGVSSIRRILPIKK